MWKGGEFNKMAKKLFSSIVAVMVVFAAVAPSAYAETSVGNVGNGVDTNNTTSVNQSNNTTVSQNNAATVTNNISVKTNTGGNTASRNTGGDVVVDTGSAGATVSIENVANRNSASVDSCCQGLGDVTVLNNGNGDSSDNEAKITSENNTGLFQNNAALFNNEVDVKANTGKNNTSSNTGGDVFVGTGNALVGTAISNSANENRAVVGRAGGAAGAADVLIGNSGNGVDSDNTAKGLFSNNTTALQNNTAVISNYVGAETNTGYNKAGRNTGGDVVVDTGASQIVALLDTRANFNAASLDNCGCVGLGDVTVKNVGNGDSADSYTKFNRENNTEAFQNNASDILNMGEFYDNTGKNNASSNTGVYGYYSDPAVYTGNAVVDVSAETAANENLLNNGSVAMPTAPVTGGNTNGNAWWMMWGYNWML